MEKLPLPGEYWRHFRGRYYKILPLPVVESTELNLETPGITDPVFYESATDKRIWVRSVSEFTQMVEIEDGSQVQRFTYDKYYEG